MRQYSYDVFGDLAKNVEDDSSDERTDNFEAGLPQCPRLVLFALIDTGSQVTCISDIYIYIYILC